jgi:hypothetical protein
MIPLLLHARSAARGSLAAALLLLPPAVLRAQAGEFSVPPNNILPNYNRIGVGQREALEGGAYVARSDDALANWYNPAGLALSEKTALNASSNVYEMTRTTLSGIGERESGTRFRAVGGFVGIVIGKPIARSDRWRFGFGLTSPVAWAPSSLDGAFNLPVGDATEAFGYSTEVKFNTVIPSLNAAYRVSPTLRAGIGVGYGITDLSQTQTLTDRLVSATDVVTGIRAFSTDGSVYHLLLTGGVQWDIARAITVGATVSPPGFRMGGSSKIRFTQTLFQAAGTEDDLAFRDPEAKLDYRMPFRAAAGATFRYSRGQVELDVRYYGAEDQYELLSSDSTAVRITTDAAGVPTVTAPAFTPVLHQARSIVSYALGANYSISRSLRVHGGVFTDPSPVSGPSRSTFRAVNLTGASGGVSLGSGRLTGSVGISASWGTAADRAIGPSLGGVQATTDVSIRTFTALYAVSFTF